MRAESSSTVSSSPMTGPLLHATHRSIGLSSTWRAPAHSTSAVEALPCLAPVISSPRHRLRPWHARFRAAF
eukprot:317377-Prymnesium_polylepis.1